MAVTEGGNRFVRLDDRRRALAALGLGLLVGVGVGRRRPELAPSWGVDLRR